MTFDPAELVALMPRLQRQARARFGDEWAEELLQQSYWRALRHAKTFVPGSNLGAWVWTIVVRESLRPRRPFAELGEHPVSPRQDMAVEALEVARLLDQVPEIYRWPLMLVAEGWRYPEIASHLNLPLGTVRARISRGRVILGRLCEGLPAEGAFSDGADNPMRTG